MAGWEDKRDAPDFTCTTSSWYRKCEAMNVYPLDVEWEVVSRCGVSDYDRGSVGYLRALIGDEIRMIVGGKKYSKILQDDGKVE